MFKNYIRIVLGLALSLFLFCLCSCYDLGSYNEGYTTQDGTKQWKTDYYDYFPNVIIYKDFKATSYNMNLFYNEASYSSNPISDNCPIEEEAYEAIVIPVAKDLVIGEFRFFIESSKSCVLNTSFYVSDSDITISSQGDDSSTTSENNKKQYIVNGNPSKYTITSSNKFSDTNVKFLSQADKTVTKGKYLIFLFENNISENDEKCNFRFTNILISNVSK